MIVRRLLLSLALALLVLVVACAAPKPASVPEESAGTCAVDIQAAPQPALAPAQTNPAARPSPSDMVPRITIDELRQKMESGANILIVDNRHKEEYDLDHIKGAVLVPLDAMTAKNWTPPPDRDLVLY